MWQIKHYFLLEKKSYNSNNFYNNMHYPLYIIFTRMSSFSAVCVGIFETMVSYSESIIIQPNNFSTESTVYRKAIIGTSKLKKNTNKKECLDNPDITDIGIRLSHGCRRAAHGSGGRGTALSCHSRSCASRKATGAIGRRGKKRERGHGTKSRNEGDRHRPADFAHAPVQVRGSVTIVPPFAVD